MAEVQKNGVSKEEMKLVVRALGALRASVLRSKTKEAGDDVMQDIYAKRIAEIDNLTNKMASGGLF